MTEGFGYVEFESIEAAERTLKCESHVIQNHKLTVENHRNGLATAKMFNQAAKKSQASLGKGAQAQRLAKPSFSEESKRGLQFESSMNHFGISEQAYGENLAEFDDEADREDLEDQQDDFSEDEESEESESEDEEEESPEGESESIFRADQKDPKSSAENQPGFGCASNNFISNSFGERSVKPQTQPCKTDGQPIAASSTALFSQCALDSARSPPDKKKNIVGCTPESTQDPASFRESSHLKRLICSHSRKIRSLEKDANYNFNSESSFARKARILRLGLIQALSHQNMQINALVSMHGRTTGTNFQFR